MPLWVGGKNPNLHGHGREITKLTNWEIVEQIFKDFCTYILSNLYYSIISIVFQIVDAHFLCIIN